ncbi:MAG: hypothetical protein K5849_07385 [Bacteroidales bacterium]|nr:hypothetical protein [Bacteroidales bacterium]
MKKNSFTEIFERRKSHLDLLVKRDYIRNGVATIPCCITNYYDIINSYSAEGYETLNPGFVDYVNESVEAIPVECPVVLEIIGKGLSEKEKKSIEAAITDAYAYTLGIEEKEEKRQKNILLFYCIGLIVASVILGLTEQFSTIPREIIFVLFWFFGDRLFDFIFLGGREVRHRKRLAGRIASVKIYFSESYEGPDWSEQEAKELFAELEKNSEE